MTNSSGCSRNRRTTRVWFNNYVNDWTAFLTRMFKHPGAKSGLNHLRSFILFYEFQFYATENVHWFGQLRIWSLTIEER